MANGWATLSDTFSPAETLARAEQIKQMQNQNRLAQLALADTQRQQQSGAAFDSWLASQQGQPVPTPGSMPQAPVMPQPTPEQLQAAKGQAKIANIYPKVTKLFENPERNADGINRINSMLKNDADIQTALRSMGGFDDVDIGYDKKNKTAWQRYTKNWTKEELQKISESVPGGQVVSGLPAGSYTIDYDPINKVMRPNVQTAKPESAPGFTGDTRLIRDSLREKLGREPTATEILDEKRKSEAETYAAKYGAELTDADFRFAAEQYLKTGQMPPMGRSAYARAKIMQQARMIADERGQSVDEIVGSQAEVSGLRKSLEQQLKVKGAMGGFVRNLNSQVSRLDNVLNNVTRLNARYANLPIRNFKMKIKGDANESILDMYLTEISSEIGKLSTGSSASVAELSASAREKWEKIHDPNLSIGQLKKLLEETRHAANLRMQSVTDEIANIKSQITGKKKEPSGSKQMTFNPSSGRFE